MSDDLISVALIDDDKDDHILIKDLLNAVPGGKYKLHWFSDSHTGLEALRKHLYDIYLLDYHLDTKSGLDILEEMQKQETKRSIILLTGQGSREVDIAAMNKGASDFLPKENLTSEVLERSIRYCIKRAQDHEKIKETEKLKFEKETSEQANRAKSLFLANMSHEIRTPLGAILGFAELGLEPDATNSDKIESLKTIKRNGEHLLELINDILDLSKVEAGQLQMELTYFNWRDVVIDIIETLSPKIRAKPLTLNFSEDPTIPLFLKNDSHRLRQILMNLVGNAVKFTEKGAVHIKVSVEKNEHKKSVIFDISDTGIGLSKEDQKKLFQPFQQANSTHSRRYGGTGLGLDLSRKLARALGGELQLLSSEVERGSVFRLTIPGDFSESKVADKCPVIAKSLPSSLKRSKVSVLLVEDAVENQIIVKSFLKDSIYEIDFADNGVEGIKNALAKSYDLILMDIQMPILDGVEATQILRDAGLEIPIVALTAHALKEDRARALSNGFTEYITKPFNKAEFKKTIERVLEVDLLRHELRTIRQNDRSASLTSEIQH